MGARVYPTRDDEAERTTDPNRPDVQSTDDPEAKRENFSDQVNGKPVVSLHTGEKIGSVSDVLIDPETLRVAALVISKGGLFNRETMKIPATEVQLWGKDVILVRQLSSQGEEGIQVQDHWVQLSDQIRGRYVVSKDGRRVGKIEDVTIDQGGRLIGYNLSQVFIDGPLSRKKHIPAEATYSLGKDILIVESSAL